MQQSNKQSWLQETLYSSYIDGGGDETEAFDEAIDEFYEVLDEGDLDDDETKEAILNTLKKLSDLVSFE